MALIDDVRTALRGKSHALDGDLQIYIDTAVYDLKRAGITVPSDYDQAPEIKAAIVMYCKAQFGVADVDRKAFFTEAYEKLRLSLLLDSDKAVV